MPVVKDVVTCVMPMHCELGIRMVVSLSQQHNHSSEGGLSLSDLSLTDTATGFTAGAQPVGYWNLQHH